MSEELKPTADEWLPRIEQFRRSYQSVMDVEEAPFGTLADIHTLLGALEASVSARSTPMAGAEPPKHGEAQELAFRLIDEWLGLGPAGAAYVREQLAALVPAAPSVEPAPIKCRCQTCAPITLDDMRMVLCPKCGNKRCPHANDHRNECTESNEPGQPGSAYPTSPSVEPATTVVKESLTAEGRYIKRTLDAAAESYALMAGGPAPQQVEPAPTPALAKEHADRWLENRSQILDAISEQGFRLMENANGWKLVYVGAPHQEPGWVRVPVEPTHAQAKAAADAWLDCGSRLFLNKALAAVRAGIAAAPKEPKP